MQALGPGKPGEFERVSESTTTTTPDNVTVTTIKTYTKAKAGEGSPDGASATDPSGKVGTGGNPPVGGGGTAVTYQALVWAGWIALGLALPLTLIPWTPWTRWLCIPIWFGPAVAGAGVALLIAPAFIEQYLGYVLLAVGAVVFVGVVSWWRTWQAERTAQALKTTALAVEVSGPAGDVVKANAAQLSTPAVEATVAKITETPAFIAETKAVKFRPRTGPAINHDVPPAASNGPSNVNIERADIKNLNATGAEVTATLENAK